MGIVLILAVAINRLRKEASGAVGQFPVIRLTQPLDRIGEHHGRYMGPIRPDNSAGVSPLPSALVNDFAKYLPTVGTSAPGAGVLVLVQEHPCGIGANAWSILRVGAETAVATDTAGCSWGNFSCTR
jgi:hypothetical protein